MHRIAVIIVACTSLSGCLFSEGPWPAEGAGGFAEYLPITDNQLKVISGRLEAARRRGAETYDSAAFAAAELLLTRSRREIAAGLVVDANADIARLEAQVDAIDATLSRKRVELPRVLS